MILSNQKLLTTYVIQKLKILMTSTSYLLKILQNINVLIIYIIRSNAAIFYMTFEVHITAHHA